MVFLVYFFISHLGIGKMSLDLAVPKENNNFVSICEVRDSFWNQSLLLIYLFNPIICEVYFCLLQSQNIIHVNFVDWRNLHWQELCLISCYPYLVGQFIIYYPMFYYLEKFCLDFSG